MPEHQRSFDFGLTYDPPPVAPPDLREEVARAWSLPLGERVTVTLRAGQLDSVTGTLELAAAPDYPWNSRDPLALRIAGYGFSSRDIERWIRL